MQHIDSSIRTRWCEAGDPPAAVIDSGEVITVDSASFTEGYSFETMHTLEQITPGSPAPLTAPIIIRGATPGGAVRVDVLDLEFLREFGCMLLAPGKGAFPDVTDRRIARAVMVNDYYVAFSDTVKIPTRKMLGKVSVAPQGERVLCNQPGRHGGNMDNRDITIGSSVYLPVSVEGAHLGVGDGHAVQGDGECGGSAVEVEMRTTLRATALADIDIRTPVVRSGGFMMTMGAGSTLDEAADQALSEMHRLLRSQLGMEAKETAMMMSLVCDVHVSQLVNPLVSAKVRIPELYLTLP